MKKLWHAIKSVFTAVVDWVATLFGMKDNGKYGRAMRGIISTAFAAVVIVWAVSSLVGFGRSIFWDFDNIFDFSDEHVYFSEQVSDDIAYYDGYYGHYGYLKNAKGRKVLRHISWIQGPLEGDSLVCYSNGELRGYFHMRDGHVVVKPVYERAWIFSDGLAAVGLDGKLKFIDAAGNVVIDRGFKCMDDVDGYVFHNGHCAVYDSTGKHMGLIGRDGNWVLPPVYANITPTDTFWMLKMDQKMAVLTFGMDTVMPLTAARFDIYDTTIQASYADHSLATYSLQGELLMANQMDDVEQLTYDTDEMMYSTDTYGELLSEQRSAVATCLRYETEYGWYGLMSPDGHVLTPPVYVSIYAISKDLYLCKTDEDHGVVIDSHGRQVQ